MMAPVVFVNPSGRRRGRRRRRRGGRRRRASNPGNPRRRRRRRGRRGGRRRARRRNPSTSWADVFTAGAWGLGGGGTAYLANLGLSMAPIGHWWQTAAFLGGGTAASLAAARWASLSLGAALMGGVTALGIGRVREGLAMGALAKEAAGASNGTNGEASGYGVFPATRDRVFALDEAGRIYEYNAGRLVEAGRVMSSQEAGAVSMSHPAYGDSFIRQVGEAGAVVNEPGAPRLMGPNSWIHNRNVREVSAHNR